MFSLQVAVAKSSTWSHNGGCHVEPFRASLSYLKFSNVKHTWDVSLFLQRPGAFEVGSYREKRIILAIIVEVLSAQPLSATKV